MIKKCDHTGCTKAGTCRAPKSRELHEYWFFCQEHAAEYNKNWNYYADMSPDEIEADWERQTFGTSMKDKNTANTESADYVKFINDFITGRSSFDHIASQKKTVPSKIVAALKIFDLGINASWREIGIAYRLLAKKHHPDTAKNKKDAAQFSKITDAYNTLKTYHKK